MESEYSEKITLKYPPCTQSETPCIDYDYDPCESSDDITEKDLAILLKEEARLRAEREVAEREVTEAEGLRREQELLAGKKDLPELGKPARKCKKPITNPFFSNRLDFSTCAPPPPPTPPPQFFPTYDEEKKVCKKRKKKYKKKEIDETEEYKEVLESESEEEEKKEREREREKEKEEKYKKTESEEPEIEDPSRQRRKCKKLYRPPCCKRSFDISNAFQPRQIPARQRDLPPTSPLEMPEVERQIWLSSKNDCETECAVNICKRSCPKKTCGRKRKSSENRSSN